jgi:hypothetical protein
MDRNTSSRPPPVTYHVREPGLAASRQAGSDSGRTVEKAMPPQAAKAGPTGPSNPVRALEGRVSTPSMGRFVRLLACLMGALHGVSAQDQVGLARGPQLTDSPGHLDEVVELLSNSGVELFLISQRNKGDRASLITMNAVLLGLLVDEGEGTLLQQGVGSLSDVSLDSLVYREAFESAISKNVKQVGHNPHGGFAKLWNTGLINAHPDSIDPMTPVNLDQLIDAPKGTVVGLSKEAAFYLHAGPDTLRFPGRSQTVAKPNEFTGGPWEDEKLFGLFQAASGTRQTALVVTDQALSPKEVRELYRHFKGQFAVSTVKLENDVSAIVVAPLSADFNLTALKRNLAEREADSGSSDPDLDADLNLDLDGANAASPPVLLVGAAVGITCVFVYKTRSSRSSDANASTHEGAALSRRSGRKTRKPDQSSGRLSQDLGMPMATAVSYQVTPRADFPPSSPHEIAASVRDTISRIQDDRENGKSLLKQYLKEKGVEFHTLLDPDTGTGAEGAASVAAQLCGILESTSGNTAQMGRWLEGGEFMNGVSLDFVFQTVKDHARLDPQNRDLVKAASMLQDKVRSARGESDDDSKKESPAARASIVHAGDRPQDASGARAMQAMGTPPSTAAEIFEFGRKMVGERVPAGADLNGVRLGQDIYIPSAVITPHWHLNKNFAVFKHDPRNHLEVAKGSVIQKGSANSAVIRLNEKIPRDQQLLRVHAYIQTGRAL